MGSLMNSGKSIYLLKKCLPNSQSLHLELTLPEMGCKKKTGSLQLLFIVTRGCLLWLSTLALDLVLIKLIGKSPPPLSCFQLWCFNVYIKESFVLPSYLVFQKKEKKEKGGSDVHALSQSCSQCLLCSSYCNLTEAQDLAFLLGI